MYSSHAPCYARRTSLLWQYLDCHLVRRDLREDVVSHRCQQVAQNLLILRNLGGVGWVWILHGLAVHHYDNLLGGHLNIGIQVGLELDTPDRRHHLACHRR